MVAVTWDGRTTTGTTAPAGRYTWQVSGTDDDYWMRNYDGRLNTITGTITKTS